jgi:protein-S-isoprenylcysteine O-methyltransferase Ste14
MGVFSAVMIVSGAVALALTAALGTGWLLNMSWFREMMRQVTPDGDVPAVHAWSMLAIGTLYALSLLLPGSMLAIAARQVKLASLRGSAPVLEASLRNLGRFFQTWILAALLITLLSGIWTLYSWRHRAVPKPPDPTTQRVAI